MNTEARSLAAMCRITVTSWKPSITTAYLRTENFQQAVEENVRYLHPPVQEVFQHFLMRIKHIDPDMDAALVDLKAAIDNEVWREWCDAVMACQADRSLTSILTPIVSKLSDMRVVNAELENLEIGRAHV